MHSITPESLFVVSGGARGITADCVIAMAHRYRCRFLLLGRSAHSTPESAWASDCLDEPAIQRRVIERLTASGEKPTPRQVQKIVRAILAEREITTTLQQIAQAGGQAEYLGVDITDLAALQASLPPVLARLGTVSGILHGAGTLADRLIENKTLADFEQVYTVKVTGLANLLACIPIQQLEYLVLFTSVAGFYGNIGQADYALANEILNTAAHRLQQHNRDCRVVAINWGPWDGGMVTPAIKQLFADRNIEIIPPHIGTQMLLAELEATDNATEVVVGSPLAMPALPLNAAPRSYRIHRRLSLAANPFLQDHIVGEHAVLPAVFGVSWLCGVCEQLYPGYTLSTFADFRVLKGIVFDQTLADDYVLEVQERELDEADGRVVLDTIVSSTDTNGRLRYHYRGTVTLLRDLPPAPHYTAFDRSETYVVPGSTFYANRTLFHGPTLQGIERTINISEQRLTLICRSPILSPQQQGQFPIQTFNPYQTDIQFQCMLIWARHYYNVGSMPLRADLVEHFRVIPQGATFYVSMEVTDSTPSKLLARVHAHDAEGRLYMRVTGAEVTLSERLNHLFEIATPRSNVVSH